MRWLSRCLPRSLVGRILALYTLALATFVGGALAVFIRFQFTHELDAAQRRADGVVSVVAPAISDSAVIGDYDTIQRTLAHAIAESDFASAAFIDLKGGMVRAERRDPPDVIPPSRLASAVAHRIYDTNLPIVVGGRDYGVLRLSFAADQVAGEIWRQLRAAMALALGGLVLGLLLIWMPLKRWLGSLAQLQTFGTRVHTGASGRPGELTADAPIEFQRTFEVLSRVSATLQTQREQAAVTLHTIADAVLTLDVSGHVLLANPAACELLDVPEEAILGRAAHDLLPEVLGGHAGYTPRRGESHRLVARGQGERVVEATLSPIKDNHGRPCGHVLALRDVSRQHALDMQLQDELRSRRAALTALRSVLEGLIPQAVGRHRETDDDIEAISRMITELVLRMQEHSEQLNAIFALSPDGFVSFDQSAGVSYVSPAFVRLTGLNDSDVLGLTEAEFARVLAARCLAAGAEFPAFDALRLQATEGGGRSERPCVMDVERPTRRTLQLTLRSGQGGGILQVLHLRDVTRESEVDQLKSEFLSTAAHELRTPMASIYGFSELMMYRKLSAERQQEVISTIYRQTSLMISIVNELLDLARIEARRGKDFVIETIDLRSLVADIVHDFKPPNERESALVELPQFPQVVKVDRSKFMQALGNVLSNAYKYSADGSPVQLRFVSDRPGSRVGVCVQDRGIGMTPEQLARVCERFYRAEASGSIPGTGLGMSIVKEIVELLGGSLAMSSQPGVGTEVTLWLPLHGDVSGAHGAAMPSSEEPVISEP